MPARAKTAPKAKLAEEIRARLATRSIVMVGLMGAGKTAIGRRLAQQLGLDFVDADAEIERAAGKTIAEIFEEHGEPYFRDGERKVIERLLKGGPQVLATGGGAFMDERTRKNVRKHGVSVWLNADLTVLMRRIGKRSHRPLLKTKDPEAVMKELIATRYPVYRTADVAVETRDGPHDAIVADVIARLADVVAER